MTEYDPNLQILKLAKPAKKYKLQSCILCNSRLSTNQQYRTQQPKRSREKTKKQWLSSNSRFASVLTSDGAGIHRHATFICIAYTRERGGRKNLTHSGITATRTYSALGCVGITSSLDSFSFARSSLYFRPMSTHSYFPAPSGRVWEKWGHTTPNSDIAVTDMTQFSELKTRAKVEEPTLLTTQHSHQTKFDNWGQHITRSHQN